MAAMLRLAILATLLIASVPAARAAEVADLYRAETIVTGTQEPERTRGFRAGLVDVLVKLTGDARLAEGDALAGLLEEPHRYVEWFEYEDRMKGIPVHDEQGTRDRPHFLRMRFEAAAIDREMAALGLAKWPAQRPLLAVWLAIRSGLGDYVLSASGSDGYGQRAVILETAARRGVPVWLPERWDAGAPVTLAEVEAREVAKIGGESGEADALLVGTLSTAADGYWDIAWHFAWRDVSHDWTRQRVSFDTALRDGLQTAALILSGTLSP